MPFGLDLDCGKVKERRRYNEHYCKYEENI
jgi:hypothetical protein